MKRRGTTRAGRRAGAAALAATLHDPTAALVGEIAARLPTLRRLYAAIFVATSPPTAARVNAALAMHGAYAGTPRTNLRGALYRLALRRALASGASRIHYLDFDRALHWARRDRGELEWVLRLACRRRALLVGRTVGAHRTHHRPLVATETLVNRSFTRRLVTGGSRRRVPGRPERGSRTAPGRRDRRRVDFLVPSFVLTRELAGTLLGRSRARDGAIYGEWPALLAGLDGALGYVECRGLDWETPDRFRAEVRRVGMAAWRARWDTAAEWDLRLAMAEDFVRGFRAALARWPSRRVRLIRLARP